MTDPKQIEIANLSPGKDASTTPVVEVAEPSEEQLFKEFGQPIEPPAPKAEAPKEPIKEPVKPPVVELPKAVHSAYLTKRAVKYGAPIEAINAATPEELEAWVDKEDALREAAPVAPKVEKEAPKEDGIDWGVNEAGEKMSEKDFTPWMAKIIRDRHEDKKEIKALKENDAKRSAKAADDSIDDAFRALDETVFGKGDRTEIGPDEMNRRGMLLCAAGIDFKNPPPPKVLAKKLKEAAELLNITPKAKATKEEPKAEEKSAYEAAANGKPAERITKEQWAAAATAAPAQRNGTAPKGRQAAMEAAKKFMIENSIQAGDSDDTHFDIG